jgi:hypothetical protein
MNAIGGGIGGALNGLLRGFGTDKAGFDTAIKKGDD